MPRGRMLNKKISQDEKVAKLSLKATLLYTWCIPYLDVKGRMYGDVWTLKSIVPHVKEITPQNIPQIIQEWVDNLLVVFYGDEVHKYIEFKGFGNNQNINPDREAQSEIPNPDKLLSNSGVTHCKVNISKVKGSELQTFFSYYLLKTKKSFHLTDANKTLIEGRLKEGYTIDQLKQAVDNFIQDEWPERKNHLDLIYCIGRQKGKPDNLEKWLNYKPREVFKLP